MKRTQIICDGDHPYKTYGQVIDPLTDACFTVKLSENTSAMLIRSGIVDADEHQHFCSRACAIEFINTLLTRWETAQRGAFEAAKPAPEPVPVPPPPPISTDDPPF
jgi:hypothetical protein